MKVRRFIILATALVALLYFSFVNHNEAYEVGIARNYINGELTLQYGGFHFTWPWILVARIDTRPTRVCITSATQAFNCKLVQFEPSAYREFVAVQGFRYYWWANRISFNLGYSEEYRGMRDILRGYAFGIQQYPFLKVITDYSEPPK